MIDRLLLLGITGDLAGRFLIPALGALHEHGLLPRGFRVIGTAPGDLDDVGLRELVRERLEQHAPHLSGEARLALAKRFQYSRVDFGALISINVFAVAFGVTWGPVTWVMMSELFDSDLRTSAVAVATAANWLTNWVVTRTFPLLAGMGLGVAYGVYAGFALVAVFFALKKLPETRGRRMS